MKSTTKNIKFKSFAKKNRYKMLKAIREVSIMAPLELNLMDNRMIISRVYCHHFDNTFEPLTKIIGNNSYDMMFNSKSKISVKIMQSAFQRQKKNDEGFTKPKEIALKNCLGSKKKSNLKTLRDLDFEYLFVIQRGEQKDNKTISIGFGVISKKNIMLLEKNKHGVIKRIGDQIKLTIENNEFDFFSGVVERPINNSKNRKNKLNNRFNSAMDGMCDIVLYSEDGSSRGLVSIDRHMIRNNNE